MKDELTPKERVSLVINHKEADRVPLDFGGTAYTSISREALKNLSKYLNIGSKLKLLSETSQDCIVDEDIQRELHSDFKIITLDDNESLKIFKQNKYIDEWGIKWKRVYLKDKSYYYEILEHPLKQANSLDEIINYKWPKINDENYKYLEDKAKIASKSNYCLVGSFALSSIFGIFWYLRGLDKFLIDLIANKDFARILMDTIIKIQQKRINKFLEKVGRYLDIFCLCGDLGTQDGLLISPALFREMIKPIFKDVINEIKNYTQAKIFYHSCGNIYPLVEDFIDCGIDILNPVQVSAKDMDTKRLKKEFGDKVVFWGAIDTQRVLPYGNVVDVENEVSLRIKQLSQNGGYVLAPVHNIQGDVPPENIIAMYEYGYKYGKY